MKKILASVLISTLLLLPAPAFAEPSTRVNVDTLTFDKIEQHMNSYNTQISANFKSLSDIKVPSDNDKTALQGLLAAAEAQIILYDSKISALEDLEDDGEVSAPYLIDIYTSLKATSESNKTSLQNQINNFDSNKSKASDSYTRAALQYESANKQVIWGTEQVYISYNSLSHQLKQQQNQLNLLRKQYDVMKLRQQIGLVSKSMLKSLEKSVKDLEFAVSAMTDQQRMLKEQLNITLNQNHDTNITISAIPELEMTLINSMNLEEDYKSAVSYSYSVRAKDDSYDREAEERKFKLSFKKSYENVMDKKESYDLELFKWEDQIILFDQAQLKYKLGTLSKLALEEQKAVYDNQVLKAQIAKDDLFKAYRQYEWAKKGLSF